MSARDEQIIAAIKHYQQCLDKYLKRENESRILHCINKLRGMPITVAHLEETGIGRTVNSLRRVGGNVGDAAKSLVSKWKEMVEEEREYMEQKESEIKSDCNENEDSSSETNDYKPNDVSSHDRDEERKSKHSSNTPEMHSDSNYRKEKENRKHHSDKHDQNKYSKKRKHENDRSTSEEEHESKKSKHKSSTSKDEQRSRDSKASHKKREPEKRKNESSEDEYSNDDMEPEHDKLKRLSSGEENEKKRNKKHSHEHRPKENQKDRKIDESKLKEEKERRKSKDKHRHKKSSGDSSKKDDEKRSKSKGSREHKPKSGVKLTEEGIGSGSGASFAEALGMLEPSSSKSKKKVAVVKPFPAQESSRREDSPLPESSKIDKILPKPKMEPLDLNLSHLLPEITPNYRPLGNFPLDGSQHKNKNSADDETLSSLMYSKISRTKVYSGNKVFWGKVPTLFELCIHVLQDNIDALEYTGGVPYNILKPVLERANPDQLYTLEHYNAYLVDDTDELWQLHCHKEFRSKQRQEMESWRDMYMRCVDERETKLRALTANIKLAQDKSLPVRQTKLAYVDSVVKPPRNVARKQAKNGTGSDKKPMITPSSRLTALATAGAAGQIAVPNPAPRASSTSSAASKPKKAPLMQKTLAFMKNRCFRR